MSPEKRRPPAVGADGASVEVQVAELNATEDKPIPGNFQRLGTLTGRIVARLERERLEPVA